MRDCRWGPEEAFPNLYRERIGRHPGGFAQLAATYSKKWKIPMDRIKDGMTHVSAKSHANAVMNPRAHLRKAVTIEEIKSAPMVAYPLGLYDCCGVTDGAAAAVVTTPEIARSLKKNQAIVRVKALEICVSSGEETFSNSWDGAHFVTTRKAASKAYEQAGIKDPRVELSMLEVHDCFSITEFVLMEDLHISPPGKAYEDVMNGFFDLHGPMPCQVDGGLKCFGHPIGASGLRMIYAAYEQILERIPEERKIKNARIALTHNLGGRPHQNITAIAIVGKD